MTPSDMTVWDRLALLFPTCTSDEIKTWYGSEIFSQFHYDVTDNLIRKPVGVATHAWFNARQLRAAIDATAKRTRPWHQVAQEALADTWLMDHDPSTINSGEGLEYRDRETHSLVCTICKTGPIYNWTGGWPEGFIAEHNEIASLLRAAGLTQFKCYKLIDGTE